METKNLFGKNSSNKPCKKLEYEGRRTTWQDNIKTWTGLSLAEAVRATEDCVQWRKIVHDAAKPRTTDSPNRTEEQHHHTFT